jgi:hypothetical protein
MLVKGGLRLVSGAIRHVAFGILILYHYTFETCELELASKKAIVDSYSF